MIKCKVPLPVWSFPKGSCYKDTTPKLWRQKIKLSTLGSTQKGKVSSPAQPTWPHMSLAGRCHHFYGIMRGCWPWPCIRDPSGVVWLPRAQHPRHCGPMFGTEAQVMEGHLLCWLVCLFLWQVWLLGLILTNFVFFLQGLFETKEKRRWRPPTGSHSPLM